MKEYHKIQTVFKRDPGTKMKTLLMWDFSIPEFEYLRRNEWEFTEKVDGTNIRVVWNGEKRRFAGKTENASIPATLVEVLESMFPLEKFAGVDEFKSGVCLYGEGYGTGIQKGGKYLSEQSFVLFDVVVVGAEGEHWWLRRDDVNDVADRFAIRSVPVIGSGTLDDLVDFVAPGFKSQWGDFEAEGVVARPKVQLFTRMGDRIITKLKCRDFQKEIGASKDA